MAIVFGRGASRRGGACRPCAGNSCTPMERGEARKGQTAPPSLHEEAFETLDDHTRDRVARTTSISQQKRNSGQMAGYPIHWASPAAAMIARWTT